MAHVDQNLKKDLYQNRFYTPEYFWFTPENLEFVGFELIGNQYQEITPDTRGWRWSQVLGLYLGVETGKLRYFTPNGDLVLTPEEAAIAAQQRASEAESLLEQERMPSQRLAEQLRSLGINPDLIKPE